MTLDKLNSYQFMKEREVNWVTLEECELLQLTEWFDAIENIYVDYVNGKNASAWNII